MKKTILLMTWLFGVLWFGGCNLNEDPAPNTGGLDAQIEYTPESPAAGDMITLDASSSEDENGIGFDVIWTFEDKPASSTSSITDANSMQASFTPDVAGDYKISLTLENSTEGVSDKETMTISVATPEFITLSGSIDEDRTLQDINDDPAKKDYLVTGDVTANAVLTIDPGVVLHFEQDVKLRVSSSGALIAQGTSSDKIIFTSATIAGGLLWKGIEIESTDTRNELTHVEVSYAGNSEMGSFSNFADKKTNIGLHSDAKLTLTNSTISNGGGYGIYLRYGTFEAFSDNNFEDNAGAAIGIFANEVGSLDGNTTFSGNLNDVEIYNSTLDLDSDATWVKLNGSARYYVIETLDLLSFLNIEAGAKFDFAQDVKFEVRAEGGLSAIGSGSEKIVFTSKKANSGIHWKGLEFDGSKDQRNELTHVEVSYGGSSEMSSFSNFADKKTNIGIHSGAKVKITNTEVSNGDGYGLYMRYGEFIEFSNNNFSQNNLAALATSAMQAANVDANTTFSGNDFNGVEVFGSEGNDITGDITWANLDGDADYHLLEGLNITGGLTVSPGTWILSDEDKEITVQSGAYLNAEGTSGEHILFISIDNTTPIKWGGIRILSSSSLNVFDYVEVTYGGGTEQSLSNFEDVLTNIGGNNDANLILTNSLITDSDGYGVYFQGTINDIESASADNSFDDIPEGNSYTP